MSPAGVLSVRRCARKVLASMEASSNIPTVGLLFTYRLSVCQRRRGGKAGRATGMARRRGGAHRRAGEPWGRAYARDEERQQVQMSSMTEQQDGGKRAAQGRATRGQLVEVATRLFAEHGYEGTSIDAVLSAAGVSRGALYHHFAGKEALFEAVVFAVSERVTAELAETIRDCPDPLAALHTA